LGRIREKLLDFKHRLQDRKMYSIVLVVIAAVAGWGIYQYKNAGQLQQELDNKYNRAFYDLTGYVNNVETLLVKSLISSTDNRTALTLQEAWRQANFAQTNLGQLPVSQNILAKTSKFLTQVGDFSYSLNNQILSGKPVTDKQHETLEKLYKYSTNLNKGLDELQAQITTGRIKWKELSQKGPTIFRRTSAELPNQHFDNVDKTFQEYPTLIYDGPFSDHMSQTELKGLTGENISAEDGKKKIIDIFGKDKVANVEHIGENKSNSIKTFSYTITFKDAAENQQASIDLTQKGGHVYWMLYNRPVS
jgi:spore germination protein